MRSPTVFFLVFALLGLASSTIYWRKGQENRNDPMMLVQHQINTIYAAYWDHDITKLFQLLRFGTPMSRFIEDHAEDEIHVRVQEADYYYVNNQHGIKAIVTVEDVSTKGVKPYLVRLSMAQSDTSPTGYIVFGWEICSNLNCD